MLAIPPFGASSNIALWRANIKPPVELVVDDLDVNKREVTLSVNIAKLKSLIEKSNKKYMEELENRIDLDDLWKDCEIVVH